ncbi:MAG: hypothetical protein IVW54_17590 [Candidatus Binataceae bacterium]|nr:hypothetical protein [Candidatus Binataceae bacterium]
MAKRRTRKRKFTARLFLILALVLIIAGFITRRLIPPSGRREFQFGTATHSGGLQDPASVDRNQPARDNLNDRDREELDTLIRSKTR